MTIISKEERNRRVQIIVDDYGGIHAPYEAFYIHSILYPSRSCLECLSTYEDLKNSDGVSPDDLMRFIQEAISHAASLSRFFWPSPKNKNEPLGKLAESRGQKLRKAFQLDESSVLHNREMRNAWEHFDERLDAYLLEKTAGYFFPGCIVDSHFLADEPIGHIFKLIDPDAGIVVLMGEKFQFKDIEQEVLRIYNIAISKSQNGDSL